MMVVEGRCGMLGMGSGVLFSESVFVESWVGDLAEVCGKQGRYVCAWRGNCVCSLISCGIAVILWWSLETVPN